MCVRVLSKYTRVVKQSNSVSLETPTTSSEVACKKKLAREFGLPHFLLLNQTHEVWFSFYAKINLQSSDAAFVRKYCVFAHKFPRNSIRSLLRILHCDCLFSQTNQKVLYYKQPLCFLMCEHLIYRVVVYNVAKATYCENRQSTFRMRPYPPKLSNMIMSSSTPNEWSRSSTVFAIIGGPQR